MITTETNSGEIGSGARADQRMAHHTGTFAAALRMCAIESRPSVQFMFTLRFAAGLIVSSGGSVTALAELSVHQVAAAASWILSSISVYLLNGISDRENDESNGLDRPIANGSLSSFHAAYGTLLCGATGIVLAAGCGFTFFALTLAFLLLGYLYSAPAVQLKATSSGATAVTYSACFLTYAAGAVVAGGITWHVAVFAAVMAAWTGCVGAVVKDFSDVHGDRLAGRRTLVVVVAEPLLRRAVAANTLLIGSATAAAAGFGYVGPLSAASIAVGAVFVAVGCLTTRHDEPRARTRRPYSAYMWAQYVAHSILLVPL